MNKVEGCSRMLPDTDSAHTLAHIVPTQIHNTHWKDGKEALLNFSLNSKYPPDLVIPQAT